MFVEKFQRRRLPWAAVLRAKSASQRVQAAARARSSAVDRTV
jgi:hypothetical protein